MTKRVLVGALAWAALTGATWAAAATDAQISEIAAALESGNAPHAERLASSALASDITPLQRGRLLLDRGLARELQGDHPEALIDLTAAIETHALPPEERAQALLQRGFLLDGMERLDDAAKDYGAVIALKAGSQATALNNRANVYRRQNRLAEARRDYLAALAAGSLKPQFPYYGLGQIAEGQGDKEAARGFYARAVAADPSYQLAADRLTALGGPPEASGPDPGVIILKPPKPVLGVVLTPPAASQRLVRKPPRPAAAAPSRLTRASLRLRPAMDGPAGQGPEAQLGAWRSEGEAQQGWTRARALADGALDGLAAHIVRVDLPGKGRYFRLRVPVAQPSRLCARLQAAGQGCIPAHN